MAIVLKVAGATVLAAGSLYYAQVGYTIYKDDQEKRHISRSLVTAQTEVQDLQRRIESSIKQATELEKQAEAATQRLSSLDKQLSVARAKVADLEKQQAVTVLEGENALTALQEARKYRQLLKQQVDEHKDMLETLQVSQREAKARVIASRARLNPLNDPLVKQFLQHRQQS